MIIERSSSVAPLDRDRIGTFEIDWEIFKDDDNLAILADIFKGMIILRAEKGFLSDRFGEVIKYTAIHQSFQKVKDGAIIPDYEVKVKTVDGKVESIEWECGIVKRFQERTRAEQNEMAQHEQDKYASAQAANMGASMAHMAATAQAQRNALVKEMLARGIPPTLMKDFDGF